MTGKYCSFCDSPYAPVRHHWHQKGETAIRRVSVCYSCNCILRRPHGDPERYLLPDWDTQKWYVEQVRGGKMPISLADLVDGVERGYREWVEVRLPVDVVERVKEIVKKRQAKGEKSLTVSKYLGAILVLQVMRKHR